MADDAAKIRQLEAEVRMLRERDATAQAKILALRDKLEQSDRALTEALEQQTALGEVLRVIASKPTELQPVLDAIAESAAHVCGADDANLRLVDGDHFLSAANFGVAPHSTVERWLGRGRD